MGYAEPRNSTSHVMDIQDPDRVVDGMEERPGMVLAAIVMRPEDRRCCGPVWLERLAVWLLERAGFEVCR